LNVENLVNICTADRPNRVLHVVVRTSKYCITELSLLLHFCTILQIHPRLSIAVYGLMYSGQQQTEVSTVILIMLLFTCVLLCFILRCYSNADYIESSGMNIDDNELERIWKEDVVS
jgi:ABC-type Fe3+ transport system permease subunit